MIRGRTALRPKLARVLGWVQVSVVGWESLRSPDCFLVSEGQTDLWASPFKSPNLWGWKKFKNILMFTFFPSPSPNPQCWVPLIWPRASERGLGEGENEVPTGADPVTP